MKDERTLNPAIHAAFLRDLHRFDDALCAIEEGDADRAAQLGDAWEQLSHQLHRHHQDEESFFWPAFVALGVDTRIIDALQAEHDTMVAALGAADRAMALHRADPSAENAAAARLAVRELDRVLGDHLAHEERDLDPFSIATKHTTLHKAAERSTRRAHTEGAGTFFAWLLDGCDAEAGRIIRSNVPRPVLWLLTRTGGRRYHRSIAPTWTATERVRTVAALR